MAEIQPTRKSLSERFNSQQETLRSRTARPTLNSNVPIPLPQVKSEALPRDCALAEPIFAVQIALRFLTPWAFALALTMYFPITLAQTSGNRLRGLFEIDIVISDQIKDGCLPRPKELGKIIELELLRSGISIGLSSAVFYVSTTGFENKFKSGGKTGVCTAHLDVSLGIFSLVKLDWNDSSDMSFVEVWSRGSILVGSRDGFQNYLERRTSEIMRDFAYDLEKDRLGKRQE